MRRISFCVFVSLFLLLDASEIGEAPITKLGTPYSVYRSLGLSVAGTFKALCDTYETVFVPGYGEVPLSPPALLKQAQCNVGKPIACPVCQCFIDYVLEKLMNQYGVTIDRGSVEQLLLGLDCGLFGVEPFTAICKDMTSMYKDVLITGIMREATPYSICANMYFCDQVGRDNVILLQEQSVAGGVAAEKTTAETRSDASSNTAAAQSTAPRPQLALWKRKVVESASTAPVESEALRKANLAGEKAILYYHVLKDTESKMERDAKEVLRKVDDMMDVVKANLKCPACRCLVYFTQDESEQHFQRTMAQLMGNLKGSTTDVVKTIAQYMVMMCEDLNVDPFRKVCQEKIRSNLDSIALDILNGARATAVCSRVGYCAAPGIGIDGDEGASGSVKAAAKAALAAIYK